MDKSNMGVTYKLKQEVVGYILDQKQANPKISCRQIAEQASAHFKKKISKSSVNSILKQKSLSSPVGRRPEKQKLPKVFKLPDFRKKQLFESMAKPLDQDQPDTPQPQPKPSLKQDPDQPLKYVGAMILKAAEHQIASEPLIFRILKKYADPVVCPEPQALSRLILYMSILGIERLEDLAVPGFKGLLNVCGLSQCPDRNSVKDILRALETLKDRQQEILLDCAQLFTEADFFHFLLENKMEFKINVSMHSVWTNNNVHSERSLPVARAIDVLSRRFMLNTSSFVVKMVDKERFSSCVYPLLYACENVPGYQIKRIRLTSDKDDEVFCFDSVINRRRKAIIGIDPEQPELAGALNDEAAQAKVFLWDLRLKKICFREFPIAMPTMSWHQMIGLRAVVFWEQGQEAGTRAFLTNMPTSSVETKDILRAYLDRWPHSLEPDAELALGPRASQSQDFVILEKAPKALFGIIEEAFPFASALIASLAGKLTAGLSQATLSFFCLAGHIKKEKKVCFVHLIPPSDTQGFSHLNGLLKAINESAVFDEQGLRLMFVTL